MTCRIEEMLSGGAYPKSCPTCKFGPCQRKAFAGREDEAMAVATGKEVADKPVDIAALAMTVDSSQVSRAREELEKLESTVNRLRAMGIHITMGEK